MASRLGGQLEDQGAARLPEQAEVVVEQGPPELAVDPNDERVAVVQLGPRVPPRVIALAWHRDRYRLPAAEGFVELAQELCSELEHGLTPVAAAGTAR